MKKKNVEEALEQMISETGVAEGIIEADLQRSLKKTKHLKRILFILFAIIIICGFTFGICTPSIKLKDKKEVILDYPVSYKEPGFKAFLFGKNITKKVKITGHVNPKKIGKYTITYTAKNGIFRRKVKRIVTVQDKEKPTITLKGNRRTNVCPDKEYVEEGYEAKDNYDGDITKKVKLKKKKDQITYLATDSSKNEKKEIRKLVYKDEEKPAITLQGASTVYSLLGSNYTDAGYTAIDNCDGDIMANVKTEGTVDTMQPGTYTLTYKVTDKVGNETNIQRNVVVYKKVASSSGTPGTIYLTFDDGPANGSTSHILDVLKEEGVKATFFVTNGGPDSLIKREFDEGHTVALHTSSHNYGVLYASPDAYFIDLQAISDRVKRITGIQSKIIRFPGGSSNTVSRRYSKGIMTYLTREVLNRGYKYYDWNVDGEDAGYCASHPTGQCVSSHVIAGLSKSRSNMVLMHDIKTYTANGVRDIIRYGKSNGYTFSEITESTPIVAQGLNN